MSLYMESAWQWSACCRWPKGLRDIEASCEFNTLCNAAIVANTVCLAISVEQQASGHSVYTALETLEVLFCVFYAAELLLRIVVHRLGFFSGRNAGWHVLDGALVLASVLEQASRLLSGRNGLNVSYLRAIRLLKIVKILRVLRVMRSLKELRFLLDSILGSAPSLFWSMLIMLCTTFMFAICFMQAASSPELQGLPAHAPWHSLFSAMSSLFMAATGGIDWQELAQGLLRDGLHYHLLFFLYIGIFLFVIQNALTSVFVERLHHNVTTQEAFVVQNRLQRRIEYVEKIQELFNHMDKDGDGEVSFEELHEHLHDPRMSAFAASLDIDEEDLTTCFTIITAHGRQKINADTFVVCCIKLRGHAKSVDLIDIGVMQSQIVASVVELAQEQQRFAAFCSKHFQTLQKSTRTAVLPLPEETKNEHVLASPTSGASIRTKQ